MIDDDIRDLRAATKFLSPCLDNIAAEIARLRRMVQQMHGLASQGIDAPNAAYRWCERIDEVAITGPQDEYDEYAIVRG